MDAAAIILLVAMAGLSVLFILLPLDLTRRRAMPVSSESYDALTSELETLLVKKDSLYVGIKDLDFEHETGKLSEDDYETLKEAYARDAIDVLKEIDELEANLKKARANARRRGRRKADPSKVSTIYCSECGFELSSTNHFCGNCGAAQEIVCVSCGAKCERGSQFCASCGNQLAIA